MTEKRARSGTSSFAYHQLLMDITRRLQDLRTDYDRYLAGLSPPPPAETPQRLQRALQRLRRRANAHHAVLVRCDEIQSMLTVLGRHWAGLRACSEARPEPRIEPLFPRATAR